MNKFEQVGRGARGSQVNKFEKVLWGQRARGVGSPNVGREWGPGPGRFPCGYWGPQVTYHMGTSLLTEMTN